MSGERKKGPKRSKAKGTCPKCGQPTKQVLECPTCNSEGCVERCNAAGRGSPCNACDEKGPAGDDDEDGEGLEPGEEE
jgi:hypothetical protein